MYFYLLKKDSSLKEQKARASDTPVAVLSHLDAPIVVGPTICLIENRMPLISSSSTEDQFLGLVESYCLHINLEAKYIAQTEAACEAV